MYDTIRLRSPYISNELYNKINYFCMKKQGINLSTGELMYQIVTGELSGSWDSRISIQCRDYDFDKSGIKVKSYPYLVIEGSTHKLKFGHNIYGGFESFKDAVYFLISTIEKILCLKLPCFYLWEVRRIDISQNFYIGQENVIKWFYSNQFNDYQRRSVNRYENTGIYISGTTTTLKFYSKGDEFKRHDYKRIKAFKSDLEANRLYNIAKDILRCEVEIKNKKLKYELCKDIIRVCDVDDNLVFNIFDEEVKRFLREGESMYLVINETMKVKERLFSELSSELAKNVFSTWTMLSTFGYKKTKENISKATFYRHVKILKDLGITWYNSDISIVRSEIPHYNLCYNSDIAVNKVLKVI